MDVLFEENRPDVCLSLGLECNTCIDKSAASVARVCHGLTPAGLRGIFVQMFPSQGCAPMAEAFAAAYQERSAPPQLVTLRAVAAA